MNESIDLLKKKIKNFTISEKAEAINNFNFTTSSNIKTIDIDYREQENLSDILSLIIEFAAMNPDIRCINMVTYNSKEPTIKLIVYSSNDRILDNCDNLIYKRSGVNIQIKFEDLFEPDLYLGEILYDKDGTYTHYKNELLKKNYNWNYEDLITFEPKINMKKLIKGGK